MKSSVSLRSLLPRVLAITWLTIGPLVSKEATLESLIDGARAAMAQEKWEQALEFNSQAVTLHGGEREKYGAQFGAIHYYKGLCEMKLKRWQDALRSFEICYRDFPNHGADRGNLFHKLALLKWGEAAMGAERWELALSRFAKFREERDQARDAFPQGAYYISLAVCHYKLGRLAEGNENLEIAIRNKADFPTPDAGIIAGFQALVETAIAKKDEQGLLDFIGKNRGELIIGPAKMRGFSGVFLKLAGDALAAGMPRAALAVYQFVPGGGGSGSIKLAAVALIHERHGNIRGAMAAYLQLVRYFPDAANREDSLYHAVRTASLLDEEDLAQDSAGRLFAEFPKSKYLAEIRATDLEIPETPAPLRIEPPEILSAGDPPPASREFATAIDLYEGRKYQEALTAFQQIKLTPLAGFYESECQRKLGNLDALTTVVRSLVKSPALGADRLRQLEIDALWDAVRTKSWETLQSLARDRMAEILPEDQRAQVSYCLGLALENLQSPDEALNAYHTAMTADAGASEEIARLAAVAVLRIHLADAEVVTAMESWGKPDEIRDAPGRARLKEAAALAGMFELSLGADLPLPADFKPFLKYRGGT